MPFVGRTSELQLLDDLYHRPGAQFLLLYGRRRVGKTSLLQHWLTSRAIGPYLYWMATQTSAVNQIRGLSQALFQYQHPATPIPPTFSYASWDAVAAEVQRLAQSRPFVLVLDEFTYVMQADPEVPSLLQRAWDLHWKNTQLRLILTGSLAGMIQRTALDYHSPLYGRATARLKLQPLPFPALAELLPRFTSEQRVAAYTITGGIPAYLELFDDNLNLLNNLRRRIVTPANVMLSDAVFLLHEQLDEPRNYMALLEVIAAGYHQLSEIAVMAGLERSNVAKYLGVLRELGYVERQVPATVRHPERSHRGRYVISDPYLRFYFRFLRPHLTEIERGRSQAVLELLHDHLIDFIGTHTFEELCRDWLAAQADTGDLSFVPERIGSFWSKTAQIDVVAINWRTRDLLLGECKWGTQLVGREVVEALTAKIPAALPDKRAWRVHYILFARVGYTPDAQAWAAEHGMRLMTLAQMETTWPRISGS